MRRSVIEAIQQVFRGRQKVASGLSWHAMGFKRPLRCELLEERRLLSVATWMDSENVKIFDSPERDTEISWDWDAWNMGETFYARVYHCGENASGDSAGTVFYTPDDENWQLQIEGFEDPVIDLANKSTGVTVYSDFTLQNDLVGNSNGYSLSLVSTVLGHEISRYDFTTSTGEGNVGFEGSLRFTEDLEFDTSECATFTFWIDPTIEATFPLGEVRVPVFGWAGVPQGVVDAVLESELSVILDSCEDDDPGVTGAIDPHLASVSFYAGTGGLGLDVFQCNAEFEIELEASLEGELLLGAGAAGATITGAITQRLNGTYDFGSEEWTTLNAPGDLTVSATAYYNTLWGAGPSGSQDLFEWTVEEWDFFSGEGDVLEPSDVTPESYAETTFSLPEVTPMFGTSETKYQFALDFTSPFGDPIEKAFLVVADLNSDDGIVSSTSTAYEMSLVSGASSNGSYEYNVTGLSDKNHNFGFVFIDSEGRYFYSDNYDGPFVAQSLDLIFCIDTTGSMWDDIDAVKASATEIVNEVADSISDYRIAVVAYRDFPEDPYGDPTDYSYLDVQEFTSDKGQVIDAIQSLTVDGGADWEESVYSGVMHCIESTSLGGWRGQPIKKMVIVMGDAPPHDPEPFTGYTMADVLQAAEDADPVVAFPILIGGDGTAESYFEDLAEGTSGKMFRASGAGDVVEAIMDAIKTITYAPFPEAGGPYEGAINVPISFDASESYDPDGEIVLYEWDWDSDGTYDESSTEPYAVHAWASPFDGTIRMRVTDDEDQIAYDTALVTVTKPLFEAAFDFGTPTSPVATNYLQVTPATAYSAALGYGWFSGSINCRNRNQGSALERDLNFTRDATFVVDVPDGTYDVTVILGDRGPYWHDKVGVFLEGNLVDTVSTTNSHTTTRDYSVEVTDGQLTLRLDDLGGSDPNACIIALEIASTGPVTPPIPTISISDVSKVEGDSGTTDYAFTVSLSEATTLPVAVGYSTTDGTAVDTSDYVATSGTLSIPAGETTGVIHVQVNGDTTIEPDEMFYVDLANPQNATLGDNQSQGTIVNDDMPLAISVSISPKTFAETTGSSAATGTVTRNGPTTSDVTVNLSSNDTSEATVPTSVVIPAGEASATFMIDAEDDQETDGTQTVYIEASAAGYLPGNAMLQVTDNEIPPFEAHYDFGTSTSPVAAGYTKVTQSMGYTAGRGFGWLSGSLKSRDRYSGSALNRDLIFTSDATFAVDVPNGTYDVTVRLGDRGVYPHDQQGIYLEGALTDTVSTTSGQVAENTYEDVVVSDGKLTLQLRDLGGIDPNVCLVGLDVVATGSATPGISINDVSKSEGNSGVTQFAFTVSLPQVAQQDVSVDYTTASGSAVSSEDYTATNGTLHILAGQSSGTITVSVNGDTIEESDETFYVKLSNPTGATIVDNQGRGIILNDDFAPALSVSVSPSTFSEAAGAGAATGTVTRTGPTTLALSVNLSSYDVSEATVPTTVTIPAGESSTTFAVNAVDDTVGDGTQMVSIGASATGFDTAYKTIQVTDNEAPSFEAHYDFGTSSSPIQAGYTRVSEATQYAVAQGYGWQSGTISSRDRSDGTSLVRDLNFTTDGTFAVDVPNGRYTVDIVLGDRGAYWHDQMGVYLEGILEDTVSAANAQTVSRSYEVDVTDGQLTLRLQDRGGTDPNVCIEALDIVFSNLA